MGQLSNSIESLRIEANLQIQFGGRNAAIRGKHQSLLVEVPNVATGFSLVRSVLPRVSLRRLSRTLASSGCSVELWVGKRRIASITSRKFGMLAFVGLRYFRIHPIALALALLHL